ncbi:uncharacterized protein LOC142018671 [Carettochelys insculpta]|uniref:uncharacterized protein LOC142018671 n=1 Tax=Carettochelys insculpta TaxID=44489 RepID=UPI003EBD5E35
MEELSKDGAAAGIRPGLGCGRPIWGRPRHLPLLQRAQGPRHTTSPLATLDTSAEEPQQVPEAESAPEASPAPRGPPQEPTPGAPEEEEEERDSSSSDAGLHIILPSRSSSRASAPWVSPDRGSGPSAAPLEGPESAGEVSVVLESPPGPSLQASPLAEQRPAPRRGRRRTQHHQPPAMDPQLLALHRRQLEVAEQRLRVEERRLHLQERALAWRQEAWGGLHADPQPHRGLPGPPGCTGRRSAALPAPPAAPAAAPAAVAPPPRGTWGQLTLAGHISRSARPPSSPAQGCGRGGDPGRLPAALNCRGVGPRTWPPPPPLYIFPPVYCSFLVNSLYL